ncbi:MAG: hypothetical protein J6T10_13335 [Methanobrevibacter sp.]|nr:hypothetical protein [Methanobrevibacter sp.]MBO7693597.1 hypothetical protein [Methanobrevibacter sp.]
MKHISDSERLTQAMLNRTENRLKEAERKIAKQEAQIRVRDEYISELKATNRTLCNQISSLFSYHRNHV